MGGLTSLSVLALSSALDRREISSRELTAAYLLEIEVRDALLGAYLSVSSEAALAAAEESDRRRAAGLCRGPLDGIPYGAKDNLCVAGGVVTCGSRMLGGYVSPYSATVIERLSAAGAVLLGKTNMDEFAMGFSTETSAYGVTRNPLAPDRVPGGSSGGSAAAVAAGLAAFALGSDTGGSVRQPAAFCGVVGLRPTYGRVSRYGLVAFASSLDQVGPLSATVADNRLILSAIEGRDPRDATSGEAVRIPPRPLRKLRVGVCEWLLGEGISPAVRSATLGAARALEALGCEVFPLVAPSSASAEEALAAYYVLSAAEASSNLARFDGVRYGRRAAGCESPEELYCRSRTEGFGDEVKRRILFGALVLSEGYEERYYRRAQAVRKRLRREMEAALTGCDLLLSPTAPTVAYPLGVAVVDPTERYAGDLCTVPAALCGLPALSLPFGTDEAGLPVGVQLMGRPYEEELLFQAGEALESARSQKEAES